ncbi:MAG: hypothetical protein WC380_02100 [Pedobacter sp.]|jgi:hypothetical protein
MKLIVFILLLIQQSSILANPLPIKEVRKMFDRSTRSELECKKLIQTLQPYSVKTNSLYYGYKAGAIMLMAKHVLNPFSKLSHFKKGKGMLENAINFDNNNLELRFLRYTIQTNVPSFLNYKQNIKPDKEFIIRSMAALEDKELKQIIKNYLKTQT